MGPLQDPSAFALDEGWLRNLQIVPERGVSQSVPMPELDPFLVAIAAIFLFAGFIKGVIGLGLPTVSVSLLAVAMPPGKALAIVIVPAIVTNISQTFVGPYLRDIVRRLWPLLVCTAIGIWLNAGALSGPAARYGTIVLGILLVIYAVTGLARVSFHVARSSERWIGSIVGLITGIISAASGVQVVPSVPYLQAIGMEKDELVQALGVFFTVATLHIDARRAGQQHHCAAGSRRHGLFLHGRFRRPGGAVETAGRSLPALVLGGDDPARALPRRHRGLRNRAQLVPIHPI